MRDSGRDLHRGRFDVLTISLHWLTVTLIGFLAVTGAVMGYFAGAQIVAPLVPFHRMAGGIVWMSTALRFLWRQSFARFPAFPDAMPPLQRGLVTMSEFLLYALLLVQPLTGLAMTLVLGRPFSLVFWTVPPVISRNVGDFLLLKCVHFYGACALLSLAGGHALMALIHHYGLRDDVLATMAPWIKARQRSW